MMKITRRNAVLFLLWVGVRALASDLCFLDDFQLRTLEFVDGKEVLWFFKKSNNLKQWIQRKKK